MTNTFGAERHRKGNGAYFPILHGMQLRQCQKRLLAALLRQPGLVPTVLRSGIHPGCFPEDWRDVFVLATKEPGRGKQIAADPNGEPIIRHLWMQPGALADGQALQLADQIVASVRCHDSAQEETAVEPEQRQDNNNLGVPIDTNPNGESAGDGDGHEKVTAGQDVKELKEQTDAECATTVQADEDIDPDLAEMNNKYAVVKIGGKTRVVSFENDAAYPDCKVPVFSTIPDFCAFHANRKKIVRGKKRKIGIGRWWIDHEQRRQYGGIVYAPGSKATDGKLNLWIGFGCDSRAGNCDLYLEHLHNNICAGNKEHAEYMLNWMANAVQHPDQQGEVAIVWRGKEGTGKGVAAKQFGRLFGAHFRHIMHARHLTGNFNAHLQHCSALFADEAFFAGDKAHESVLKALVTEETLLIEPKGIDPFSVRNCIHLIMASNSNWVIPAGADARRYFMLNVGDARKQDHEYFAAIGRQMDHGGREALLHYLLNRELAGFNVRLAPHTEALADQKAHSRRGLDRLIETIAHDGVLPSAHPVYSYVAITSGEDEGEGFYCKARSLVSDLKYDSSIIIARTLKDEWECAAWHSGNLRGIHFPSLSYLRELFDKKHGKQEWPATGGEIVEWSTTATGNSVT